MKRFGGLIIFLVATVLQAQPGPGGKPGYPLPGAPESSGGLWNQTAIEFNREFTKLKSATGRLEKALGAKNPEAAKALAEISAHAVFLQGKWNRWVSLNSDRYSAPTLQDKYLKSLKALTQQLARVEARPDDPAALEGLQDVAADLQIKADNCRNSQDGLGKEIRVKVHTKADTEEVKGYEVFYAPKALLDVERAHDRFPKLSSPTGELILPPGRYALWARKDNRSTNPVFQRIGGQGQLRIEIDLPVK